MTDLAQIEQAWDAYWQVWETVEAKAKAAQQRAYTSGQIMYRMGRPDSECRDYNEQRGWWDACQADVETQPVLDLGDVNFDDPYDERWEVGA